MFTAPFVGVEVCPKGWPGEYAREDGLAADGLEGADEDGAVFGWADEPGGEDDGCAEAAQSVGMAHNRVRHTHSGNTEPYTAKDQNNNNWSGWETCNRLRWNIHWSSPRSKNRRLRTQSTKQGLRVIKPIDVFS